MSKVEWLREQMYKLYEECRHGDAEHQKWLKDKFEEFILTAIEPQSCSCDNPNCSCK